MLKKLIVIAAMLALVLMVTIPAMAEVTQEGEQEGESGDVDQTFEVSSSGDNGNQCANVAGISNTGESQNQLDLTQFVSIADDFEFDEVGSNLTVTGSPTTSCDQQVNQAAAAG